MLVLLQLLNKLLLCDIELLPLLSILQASHITMQYQSSDQLKIFRSPA